MRFCLLSSARAGKFASVSAAELVPLVKANVAKETAMMTDEWSGYFSLGEHFASHESVSHKADEYVSTPEQKCVGWPEQKYIGDAGRKTPNWGPFLRASGLGRIIHRGVSTGAA